MNDVDFPVDKVLDGIDAAREAGLSPVKINMVVRRGLNETSVVPMARWARDEGLILRFIEYMDVGHTNGWRMDDVVPAAEILDTIGDAMPLEPVPPSYPGEVADRYRYLDGTGEVGVIASVTRPFCGACTRARLSADGKLYTACSGPRVTTCAPSSDRTPRTTTCAAAIGGIWARPGRSLQRAPVRGDRVAAAGGDVRARRLSGRSAPERGRSPPGCPRVVHTSPDLVDSGLPRWAKFVEKRVDPPWAPPIS